MEMRKGNKEDIQGELSCEGGKDEAIKRDSEAQVLLVLTPA